MIYLINDTYSKGTDMVSFNQQGQTLIEVLVALGIAVTILGVLTSVVIKSLDNAQFSKDQNLATQASTDGIEIMRSLRDSNWTTFNGLSGDYCLKKNASSFSDLTPAGSGCTQNYDSYVRQVHFYQNDVNCTTGGVTGSRVRVNTFWQDGKCAPNTFCHSAQSETCLLDTSVPSP